MKKIIIAPLALLASVSLLTSCTQSSRDDERAEGRKEGMETREHEAMEHTGAMETPMVTATAATSTGTTPAPITASGVTHTKIMEYRSPAGLDQVEFTITVQSGVITSASSKTLATNDGSKFNQDKFAADIATKVVGKSVKDFPVDVIGGASLTTGSFNEFVKSL